MLDHEFSGCRKGVRKPVLLGSQNSVTVTFISPILWQDIKAWETGRFTKARTTGAGNGVVDREYFIVGLNCDQRESRQVPTVPEAAGQHESREPDNCL